MKKRMLPLLLVAVVLATAVAPVAMADHCRKCNSTGTRCTFATSGGYPFCDDTSGRCMLSGTLCSGPHPFTGDDAEVDPFAVDFVIASVERLDEPQQAAPSEPQVASVQPNPAR